MPERIFAWSTSLEIVLPTSLSSLTIILAVSMKSATD